MGTKSDAAYCFADEGERSQWAEICSLTSQQNLQIAKGSFKPYIGVRRKRTICKTGHILR